MSSLTGQESSNTQPENPVNPGTHGGTDSYSSDGASKTSGTSASSKASGGGGGGEKQLGKEDFEKTGSGDALGGLEKSVHDRGEGEHSRAV